MSFPISTAVQKRSKLFDIDSICDFCGNKKCFAVLDYEAKGVIVGIALMARVASRNYFLVCDACEREHLLPPQEGYLAYEKQSVPRNERWGLKFYLSFVIGLPLGIFLAIWVWVMLFP